ncbi:unnamed protein product [Candidula unifasciata]|uniref:Glycosyltransferase family 92 protein n=1 Tax=Candidula unifasciata TaxID=100452 RepID=A0A8S3ZH18_9EUPU|nr:unnamed protein product [Candidula unifasciata]
MNQILGAEHFVVYNYSISPAVDQILQRYQQDGLVTVLPWPVPTLDVHSYGQMAALNDCFYRNRNISRFVVVVDTDELIIPRNHFTWMELLDTISPEEHDVSALMHPSDPSRKRFKTTGSFDFRSSFFKISNITNWTEILSQFSFSDEEKSNIEKLKFLTLSQVWRGIKIFPEYRRTKYIARPEFVNVAGVHYVHSFVKNTGSVLVNDKLALVHHYRNYPKKSKVIMDTSILKFKNQLYPRLVQQCQRFPSIFK